MHVHGLLAMTHSQARYMYMAHSQVRYMYMAHSQVRYMYMAHSVYVYVYGSLAGAVVIVKPGIYMERIVVQRGVQLLAEAGGDCVGVY